MPDEGLPFLTVLAPSERHNRERGLRHKTLTDWARQVALQARRWLPPLPFHLLRRRNLGQRRPGVNSC
jgi:hypothetical protein